MLFHPLTNFEISEYYKNEPKFNGVYSRDNLPKTIKKGAYVINLDEYTDIGTYWIALFVKPKYTFYFDSFGVEHIPKEIKNLLVIKTLKQISLGYKYMIQLCLVIFVLSLLTMCLMVKVSLILLVYFHHMFFKRTMKLLKEYLKMNN